MKILLVGRNCQVGGGATFRLRASLGLRARGHDVSLAAQGGPLKPRFEAIGVRVHIVLPTPFNRWQIARLLRREQFDVLHAVTPTAGDDIVAAFKSVPAEKRPKFVLSIHGVLPDVVRSTQDNPCLAQADELICFDDSAMARLREIEGLQNRTIHQLARPVEERTDLKRNLDAKAPKIVMVSRLSKSKGVAGLRVLDVIEKLAKEFPGLQFEVVGDGTLRAEIAKRGAEINARAGYQMVSDVGALTDPVPAMVQATVLVGTAYVALEALMHGVPVVASGYETYGIVREANLDEAVGCNFGDGYPGVQETTAEFFEEALRFSLRHFAAPEGKAEMERIQARIRQRHSIAALGERLEAIYQLAQGSTTQGT